MDVTVPGTRIKRRDLYFALGLFGCLLVLIGAFSTAVYLPAGLFDFGRGRPVTYLNFPGSHGFLVVMIGLYCAAMILTIRRVPAIVMTGVAIGIVLYDRHELLYTLRNSGIKSWGSLTPLERFTPASLGPAWAIMIVGALIVAMSVLVFRPEPAELRSEERRQDLAYVATAVAILVTAAWAVIAHNHDGLFLIGAFAVMLVVLAIGNRQSMPETLDTGSDGDGQGEPWRTIDISARPHVVDLQSLFHDLRRLMPGNPAE